MGWFIYFLTFQEFSLTNRHSLRASHFEKQKNNNNIVIFIKKFLRSHLIVTVPLAC